MGPSDGSGNQVDSPGNQGTWGFGDCLIEKGSICGARFFGCRVSRAGMHF